LTKGEFKSAIKERNLDRQQATDYYNKYISQYGAFDDDQPSVLSIDQIKEGIPQEERSGYEASPNPNEDYAKQSVHDFMSKNFEVKDSWDSIQMGRKMYRDDKMSYSSIQSNLMSDVKSGEISNRMKSVEFSEYGATSKVEKDIRSFLDSGPVEAFRYATEYPAKGYLKAASRLGVGAAELLLPKNLEEKLGVTKAREEIGVLEEYQMEEINQSLMDGDYNRFMGLSAGLVVGDTIGNLILMKQGIGIANRLTGGKMALAAKGKKWKEISKNVALRSSVISGMTFISTEGSVKDRIQSASLTFVYMNTPVLSSLSKTNAGAKALDFGLNSLISATYDPESGFSLGGQYAGLKEEARREAEELGDPEAYWPLLIAKTVPIAGSDAVFSLLSRSARAQTREGQRSAKEVSVDYFKAGSDVALDKLKTNMTEKYGDSWITKMDDIDRIQYENIRRINADLAEGKLPPALDEISKPTVRVDMGRIGKLVNDETTEREWRDSEGKLVKEGEVKDVEKLTKKSQLDAGERVAIEKLDSEKPTKVLYHGTKEDFTNFKESLKPKQNEMFSFGFHFTENRDFAKRYGDRIVEAELDVKNPLDVEQVVTKDSELGQWLSQIAPKTRWFPSEGKEAIYLRNGLDALPPAKIKQALIDAGYDGLVYNAEFKEADVSGFRILEEGKTTIAIQPSQIKEVKDAVQEREAEKVPMGEEAVRGEEVRKAQDGAKPEAEKIVELSGDGEKLLTETFSEIFKQSKKAQSATLKKAVGDFKDAKKLVNSLPKSERGSMITAIERVVEASDKTKDKRVAELNEMVEKSLVEIERTALVSDIQKDPSKHSFKDANGKKVSGSVAAEYAEAVQDMQDMINTDTSPKSAWRLEQQREALERNKDIKLPQSVIQKLQQTNVKDISTEELASINNEITRLKTIGMTLHKQRQRQRKSEIESVVSKIKSTAKNKVDTREIVANENQKRAFNGTRYLFGVGALRPWNLVDLMDGGKARYDGAAFDLFINKANDRYSDYLTMNDIRVSGGEKFIQKNGMRVKDLAISHSVKGVDNSKLTLDELLSVYGSSKNRLMHNAVLHGNFKGNEKAYWDAVEQVEANPKWKQLADYIMYDYDNNYNRVRKSFIKNENKILGNEENYIPMERIGIEKPLSMDELHDAMVKRDDTSKTLPGNKFTIDRVSIPDSMQNSVKLGLFEQWERTVGNQERYINMFDQVSRMNSVLGDGELRDQLKRSYGNDYVKSLEGYAKAYGNPMSLYDISTAARGSRMLRKNFATGVLAYNFLTMSKQVPSLLLYMGQGGGRNMLTSIDDFNGSWEVRNGRPTNKLIDFVESKDPQVKHAHIERELGELKNTNKTQYEKIVGKIGNDGMKGIVALDKMVRTIGWYSVYLKGIESGKSEADAIKSARDATMRTQPAASAKDLPDLYKGDEFKNWFLMFSNQINQIYNIASYQLPRKVLDGNQGEALAIASGLIMNAMAIHVLTHKDIPDTDSEIKQMLLENTAGKAPMIGSTITSAMNGYDSENPVISLLSGSTQKAWKAFESGDDDAYKDALGTIVRNLGTASGVPVYGPKRILNAVNSGDPMELVGGGKDKK